MTFAKARIRRDSWGLARARGAGVAAAALAFAFATGALAQPAPSPSPTPQALLPLLESPVVEASRVTFSFRAPHAKSVLLRSAELDVLFADPKPAYSDTTGEWISKPRPLARDADGLWTLTLGPLPPGIYGYRFVVDGIALEDPGRARVDATGSAARGTVEILGPPGSPRFDQFRPVPRGTVHVHWYDSKATGTLRRAHVYTPPGSTRPRRGATPCCSCSTVPAATTPTGPRRGAPT